MSNLCKAESADGGRRTFWSNNDGASWAGQLSFLFVYLGCTHVKAKESLYCLNSVQCVLGVTQTLRAITESPDCFCWNGSEKEIQLAAKLIILLYSILLQ